MEFLQFLEHCAEEIPNHAVLNGGVQHLWVSVGRGGLEGVAEHALQGGEQFVALAVGLSEMLFSFAGKSVSTQRIFHPVTVFGERGCQLVFIP